MTVWVRRTFRQAHRALKLVFLLLTSVSWLAYMRHPAYLGIRHPAYMPGVRHLAYMAWLAYIRQPAVRLHGPPHILAYLHGPARVPSWSGAHPGGRDPPPGLHGPAGLHEPAGVYPPASGPPAWSAAHSGWLTMVRRTPWRISGI